MKKNYYMLVWVLAVLSAWIFTGCATELEPARSAADIPELEDAAVNASGGIRITAQAIEWPGPAIIEDKVTPMRVLIENRGDHPLRVRYDEFALIGGKQTRFSALPPHRIEGKADFYPEPTTHSDLIYDNFYVAPQLAPAFPEISPYTGEFTYDRLYQDYYYNYWREVDLPTQAMQRYALPEGVLNSGGQVAGWLFFEKVRPKEVENDQVVFRADLVNAENGRQFGEIRIPFDLE